MATRKLDVTIGGDKEEESGDNALLKKELERVKKQLGESEEQVRRLLQEKDKEAKAWLNKSKDFEKELERVKEELREAQRKEEEKDRKVTNLEKDVERAKNEIQSKDRNVRDLENEIESVNKEIQKKEEEVERQDSELKRVEKEILKVKTKLQEKESDFENCSDKQLMLHTERESLLKEKQTADEELATKANRDNLGTLLGALVSMTAFTVTFGNRDVKGFAISGLATYCGMIFGNVFNGVTTFISREKELTIANTRNAFKSVLWVAVGGICPCLFGLIPTYQTRLIAAGLITLLEHAAIVWWWSRRYGIEKGRALWIFGLGIIGTGLAAGVPHLVKVVSDKYFGGPSSQGICLTDSTYRFCCRSSTPC